MDFLGIGPLELVFILIIILLVAGPKDIEKSARSLGRGLNRLYRSANYQVIRRASQELRNLPEYLAREAQVEELNELKTLGDELNDTAKIGLPERPFQAWVQPLPRPSGNKPPGSPMPPAGEPAPDAPAGGTGEGNSDVAIPAPDSTGQDK